MQIFNRKLSKIIKPLLHVVMVDLSLDKNEFTRHGMHLNSTGKESIASLIGQHLTDLLTKQENNILPLPWIDDSKDLNTWKEAEVTADLMSLERLSNKVRVSERPKKPPVIRKNDFL
jgi:hypothetical protein